MASSPAAGPGRAEGGTSGAGAVTGFLDPADFPFVEILEANAPAVRDDLDRLSSAGGFVPWPEKNLYGEGWDVFGFYWFGSRLSENCGLCPRTAEVVAQVPNLTTAGFSRLRAGARIKPHVGYTDAVLRCHLGLVVPPDCALRVGGETRRWEQDKCLIFDDTLEHEAWNRSGEDRIVLLLDFLKTPPSDGG